MQALFRGRVLCTLECQYKTEVVTQLESSAPPSQFFQNIGSDFCEGVGERQSSYFNSAGTTVNSQFKKIHDPQFPGIGYSTCALKLELCIWDSMHALHPPPSARISNSSPPSEESLWHWKKREKKKEHLFSDTFISSCSKTLYCYVYGLSGRRCRC